MQQGLVMNCYLCRKKGAVCEESWACWKKRGMMFPEKEDVTGLTNPPSGDTVEPVV